MGWLVFSFYSLKNVNAPGEMAYIELSREIWSESMNLQHNVYERR